MDRAISIAIHLAGLGLLLFLSAFFSGSETALFSLSKTQRERFRQGTVRSGMIAARLLDTPRKLLITILVGNMFVNVAAASLIASFAIAILGNKGAGVAAGVTIILLLIFGEVTPKTIAVHNAETISRLVARPIQLFSKLIFPLRITLRVVTNFLMRFMGGSSVPVEDRLTTEELRAMVDIAEEEGYIKQGEKEMLNTIFDLRNITAAEIMTPRTEMICASEDSTLQQVLDLTHTVGQSRIPVYKNDIDDICGIAYVRDFVMWRHHDIRDMTIKEFRLKHEEIWQGGKDTLIRPPFFVPETRTAMDLFQDFSDEGVQMAILLDEYGGTAGLVTMEDLIEEVVGEINDEYDAPSQDFRVLDDLSTAVSGRASIRNVNRKLSLNLSVEEDIDTIGGYVINLFGRIPDRGEVLSADGLEFEISEVTKKSVTEIIIKKIQDNIGEEDA